MAEIEQHCSLADDNAVVHEQIEVLSGGFRASVDDPVPALYATRELAVAAWTNTMLDMIEDHKPGAISFIDGPHIDKHLMTNQTERGTQRTVEDRFSVVANVGLIQNTEAI